jgi:hypothetical protein
LADSDLPTSVLLLSELLKLRKILEIGMISFKRYIFYKMKKVFY